MLTLISDRWLNPPNTWVVAAPESRELMALCLKKLRGLNKCRLIDCQYIWTYVTYIPLR